jgi:hypothetical protein
MNRVGRTLLSDAGLHSEAVADCSSAAGSPERWKRANNLDRFQADTDDLPNQAKNVRRIIRSIRIIGDAAALVRRDLVLIDDPFERGAIAETYS